MAELTKEQKLALEKLAVKTAKQEGVQKVRRWTDVGDSQDDREEDELLRELHGDDMPF